MRDLLFPGAKGSDDKTDAFSLRYKVYTSTSDNIRTVADIEANGELLIESAKSISSLTISNLRIRGTVSYYNVIVQDLFGKKTAYSSVSATIIPKYFYALNQSDNSVSIFTVNKTTGALTQTHYTEWRKLSFFDLHSTPRKLFVYGFDF
jgi:hypothetical protein